MANRKRYRIQSLHGGVPLERAGVKHDYLELDERDPLDPIARIALACQDVEGDDALVDYQLLWATLYEHILGIAGMGEGQTPSGIIVPMGDARHENAAATQVTVVGGSSAVFTYGPGARSAFATPMYYKGPGRIPVLTFDGSTEYLTSPDASFWSRDDSAGEGFTFRVWATIPAVGDNDVLFSKSNVNNESEWYVEVAATDSLRLVLRDKVAAVECLRRTDGDVDLDVMTCFHGTYSGIGGGTAGNGIKFYQNGAPMASGAVNDGAYVKMRDSIAAVYIARQEGATPRYHSGEIAGGPLGPMYCYPELTPEQVKRQYDLEAGFLGVGA